MSLRLIKLNSGYSIPSVGMGCYNLPPAQTSSIVYEACKLGYRHFDTAVLYHNEAEVAQGISKYLQDHPGAKRLEFFYTTKVWDLQQGTAGTRKAVKDMVAKIGNLEYIDLLLLHSPLPGTKKRLESYAVLQEAVEAGHVRSVGVSNYGRHHVEELLQWSGLTHPPAVNQIEISPWVMRTELAQWCLAQGIHVEAYAPLTHGNRLAAPEPGLALAAACKKYGKSPAQVLVKWSLSKGYIPLPKSKTPSRLKENLEVNDFELTPDEIAGIDQPDSYDPTDWECTDAP
ncbi:Aldo/keto reductase [Suhomyces tanzawaensis NRRL Y-17324]|uniref:2-dehydropantolactone reductase n=1 Tax=Suhomyces tanzawaensis NRRL Y-17324 TaxID=984487 RepID=A0A1E4SIT2_9ASCO|nr:Aldo/keto reductase [Suhomyces tanzawaensis NRRL Y-17324]ODV79347.1 Aldo/keto reductase [Suhomyces tanzawaensis NRRL Y-17324]